MKLSITCIKGQVHTCSQETRIKQEMLRGMCSLAQKDIRDLEGTVQSHTDTFFQRQKYV